MAGLFWLILASAQAYDTIGATWPDDAFPIPFQVQDDVGGGLDPDELLAQVQAGFAIWEQVECADLSFDVSGGWDGGSFGSEADGHNVVYVIDEGWPADPALLTTQTIWTLDGEIVEADFALNAQYFAWSTDNADGTVYFDVQAAVAHEVGHVLGMWHSTVTGATLNPAMDGHPDARSLEDDDIEGVCSLYASSDSAGEVGDGCTESTDCVEGTFCLVDGNTRYCTTDCDTDAECPDGFACLDVGAGGSACAIGEPGGCGCASSPVPRGWWGWGLMVGLIGLWRRRRVS